MKREQFSLNAVHTPTEDTQPPTLSIDYGGPTESLREQLKNAEGDARGPDDVDIGFRLLDEKRGVLSISDRVTGAFVCEIDVDAQAITNTVAAAKKADGRYRIEIQNSETIWSAEKRTLLVYDDDGRLLRTCSLIPGGVEL